MNELCYCFFVKVTGDFHRNIVPFESLNLTNYFSQLKYYRLIQIYFINIILTLKYKIEAASDMAFVYSHNV